MSIFRKRFANHLELIDSRTIPSEYSTGPDLSYYTESAQYYYDLVVDSVKYFQNKTGKVASDKDKELAGIAYNRFVNATWGMIARGTESLTFAVKLSKNKNWDLNQAASNVWCGLQNGKRVKNILNYIYTELEKAKSHEEIIELIEYLGYLRNREAIPILSGYVLNESESTDTRYSASISLGKINRKRFDKDNSPTDAIKRASQWINSQK